MSRLDLLHEEHPGPWVTGTFRCSACRARIVATFPAEVPRLECPCCHEFNPAPTKTRPATEDDLTDFLP